MTLGVGLAAGLAACGTGGTAFTPKPVVTITPTPAAPGSGPTSPSPSVTPSQPPSAPPSTPAVKATGSMGVFMTVTEALSGTCRTVDGAPTIAMTDPKNEFYTSVKVTVVLTASRKAVSSVATTFEEDSEGFTWKLGYDAAKPVKGTSAALTVSGSTYTVKGKLNALETRGGKTRTEVLPFTIVARCASAQW